MQCSGAVPDEDLACAIVEFTLPTAPTRPAVSCMLRMPIKSGPTLRRSLVFASLAERIDLLWTAWTDAYPDETAHILERGWPGSGSGPKGGWIPVQA